jgi:hypothetical protein
MLNFFTLFPNLNNKALLLTLKEPPLKVPPRPSPPHLPSQLEKIVNEDPRITELLALYEKTNNEAVLRDGVLDILRPKGTLQSPFPFRNAPL